MLIISQYEGYKEQKAGGDITRAVVKQTLFQGLASIGLPFLIIHTSVHGAQKLCKKFSPGSLKWGPTLVVSVHQMFFILVP